jgi:hypothetical protein
MRARCYDCWSDDLYVREQVWLCSLWLTTLPAGGLRFWIREDRISLALLADSLLVYQPKFDYYI